MSNEWYFTDLNNANKVTLDLPPDTYPVSPKIKKFVKTYTSAWGFDGIKLVKPITTIDDRGADNTGSDYTISGFCAKEKYLEIEALIKEGKVKLYDPIGKTLYTGSISSPDSTFVMGGGINITNPNEPTDVRYSFKLTI
mgnify:CR=1 FL=1